jgi:hypothetical protein
MPTKRKWTATELDILRSQYKKRPLKETVFLLGRTKAAASNMVCRLGLKKGKFKIDWPEWKIQMLRDYYPNTNTLTLAEWLGVSHKTVKNKAKELGIVKTGSRRRHSTKTTEQKTHRFSVQDEEYIRANAGNSTMKEIADALSFTPQAVWDYCRRNGITTSRNPKDNDTA